MLLENTVKCTFITICEPMKNPQGPESFCLQRTEFYAIKQKTKYYIATKQVRAKDAPSLSVLLYTDGTKGPAEKKLKTIM